MSNHNDICKHCGKEKMRHTVVDLYCWPKISTKWRFTMEREKMKASPKKRRLTDYLGKVPPPSNAVMKEIKEGKEVHLPAFGNVAVCTMPEKSNAFCDRQIKLYEQDDKVMIRVCQGIETGYHRYDSVMNCAFREVRVVC